MKKHILSLFDRAHLWRTVSYFVTAVILLILSQIIHTAASLFFLFAGHIFLFYTFTHPFRKLESFVIFSGLFVGIWLLNFLLYLLINKFGYDNAIYESIFLALNILVCPTGIIAGLIGGIVWAIKNKRAGSSPMI
jgi:hypothetical protein